MGQKLAIFILLWISLIGTFNLESNEMYSYCLVFCFSFTNVTVYFAYSWQNGNVLLSLGRKSKHSYISINNFLDGYKELSLCLCSHQCIRDVMIKECKSVKEFEFSILHMGQSKSYAWDFQIDFDVLSCLH